MKTYTVRDDRGQAYKVQGPEDATDEELIAAVRGHIDPGFGTDLARAAKSGFGSFGELVGAGLGAIGADDLGSTVKDYWRESQKANAPSEAMNEREWYDPKKVAAGVVNAGVSILPSLGIGGGVGLGARALGAGAKLALGAGTAAGAAVGGAQEGYPLYRERLAELTGQGMDPAEADAQARREGLMQGAASAALNALPLGRILSRAPGRLLTGAAEAATETLEGTTQALITGKDPVAGTLAELEGVGLPSFLLGAALGGGGQTGQQAASAEAEFRKAQGLEAPQAPVAPPAVAPAPEQGLMQRAAEAPPAPPLDAPLMDPSQGPLGPDPELTDLRRMPPAPTRSMPPPVAPFTPPEPTTEVVDGRLVPRVPTGAAMDPGEIAQIEARVKREQAALQASLTRAGKQPPMDPAEVAALDAAALPERGMVPAAPEVAPLPSAAPPLPEAAPSPLQQADEVDQERVSVAQQKANEKWLKQPVQVRLSKDPDLKKALEMMVPEIGWLQQGGKASIHPDTWYDLPFAEAEKMREKAGTTSWIPRSDWWRERPVKINEKDSLAAVQKALKGEKLKPNERKFIGWMERVYREGPDAAMRADGVAEPVADFKAAPQTDTPEFKNWFGESKVRDAEGEPLVVYHGTNRDFSMFDATAKSRHIPLPGFYFSPDPERAGMFAGSNGDDPAKNPGATVMPVYLALRNPLDVDVSDGAMKGFVDQKVIKEVINEAKRKGHDGVILRGWRDGSGPVQYIAFRPEQIKSAIGNNGNFSPEDPNILREGSRAYEGRSITASDGQQLTFDFETRPGTTPEQVAKGNAFLGSLVTARDRRAGASVLADGITRDFAEKGHTSLVGQTVANAADLATLAQVFRDPRVETLRVIYTLGDKVVGQSGWSTRLPGAASFPRGSFDLLRQQMHAFRADGYWLLHNHPSGRATPSGSDLAATQTYARNVFGMRQHVVIDHNEFAVIRPDGAQQVVKRDFGSYDPKANPRVPHPLLGQQILSPRELADAAKKLQATSVSMPVLIATDNTGKVKAIVEFPASMLTEDVKNIARLRRVRAAGGAGGYLFGVGDTSVLGPARRAGYLSDVTDLEGLSRAGTSARQDVNDRDARQVLDRGRVAERDVADEVTPYQQAAPADMPNKVKVGGGEYSMLAHLGLTDAQKQIMVEMMNERASSIATQRAAGNDTRAGDFNDLLAMLNRKPGENVTSSDALRRYVEMYNGMVVDVDAAAKAFAADASNENRLKFHAAKELLGIATAPFMGYKSEAGRTLAVLSKMRDSLRASEYLMNQMAGGGDAAILDYARRVVDANGDKAKVAALTRAIYTPTWWDKFYEYWINAILSGPLTHAANIIGNGFFLAAETAAEAGAVLTGRQSLAEFSARAGGYTHGVGVGLTNAGRAFLTEEAQLTPETQFDHGRGKAIEGRLGRIVRIPGRALMGMDEMFKAIAYHGELGALAMREAKGNRTRFNEIMGGVLGRPDLIEAARLKANRMTFQDPLGPIMGSINNAAVKSKVGKLILPFVRTPTNIIKRAIEYTPAGLGMEAVRKALMNGGNDQAVAVSRMSIGTGLMLGAVSLAAQGMLTGAGPDDPGEKEEWRRLGKQPYSVLINGKWVRFSRIEPLATWLGVAADMYEISGTVGAQGGITEENFGDVAALAVTSLALNLGDKTFLRGVTDFAQAYNDPKRYLARWGQSMLLSPIPNVIAQPTREADPYMREARSLLDQFKSRIPGLRQGLARKLDIAGEPVENPGGKFVLPFNTTTPREDALATSLLELGVFKRLPSRKFVSRGNEYEFTDAQYEGYAAFVQQARYRVLTPLVNSPQFRAMKAQNAGAAAALLEKQWDSTGEKAKQYYLVTHPEVTRDLFSKRKLRTIDPSNYVSPQ